MTNTELKTIMDLNIPIKLDITEEEKEEFFIEGYKQTKAFFE